MVTALERSEPWHGVKSLHTQKKQQQKNQHIEKPINQENYV